VEAGLRSFNREMPEEINRVLTDRLAAILFCPSRAAVSNLAAEGISTGVHLVGDVMADALQEGSQRASRHSTILQRLGLQVGSYLLATVHRAGNVDDPRRLSAILAALDRIDETVVFPIHPRTRKAIDSLGWSPANPKLCLLDPVGYLDMIRLESAARLILTDSGGVQKEAYWLKVPCITLRLETEWVETVAAGWNVLAGADTQAILRAVHQSRQPAGHPRLYGDGTAAQRCVDLLAGKISTQEEYP
jgi:UDP-N-acetylglucosamine 2-epimerase